MMKGLRATALSAACLVLLGCEGASAFAPGPCSPSGLKLRSTKCGIRMAAESPARRELLQGAFSVALASALTLEAPKSADASVFFDTERYGDKELKVSTINKVKQQLRALYEKKPDLIVPMFRLAMTDCLSYDPSSGKGGGDGSVLKKLDLPENSVLKPAADEIKRIRDELVDKTQITYADIIAYAGGVAIEATGGPRVIVQLGRTDGQKEQPASGMAKWDMEAPTTEGILSAVQGSGLTAKEAVLFAGVLGSLESAATNMKTALANKKMCDPEDPSCDDDEEGYYGLYAPATIKSETSKEFGKNRGASAVNSNVGFDSARIAGLAGESKLSNSYLASVASTGGKDAMGKALMANKEMKEWVMEYGKKGSDRKFMKDAVTAYLALSELGRSNTNR